MNEHISRLYALMHGYCEKLIADIPEDEMLVQPSEGVNPPAWLLGHLAVCTDSALVLMGQEKRLPQHWSDLFGMGSRPVPDRVACPSKQQLWEAYSSGHAAVEAATHEVDPVRLAQPNPIQFLAKLLPTAGDLLAHLMTTHEAGHIGHLSNWRRQMGRPPLF